VDQGEERVDQGEETMARLEVLGLSKTSPQEATVSMVGVRPLPLRTIMTMAQCVGDLQARDLHLMVAPSPGEDPLLLEVIMKVLARREVMILTGSAHHDVVGKSMILTWRLSIMGAVARLFLLEEGLVADPEETLVADPGQTL